MLPTGHGAFGSMTEQPGETHGKKKKRSVAELIGLGFQLIRWDGRTPHPLADRCGRFFAVLAAQPDDAASSAHFPAAMRRHRRGLFAVMNVGLTFGKGSLAPSWQNNKQHTGTTLRKPPHHSNGKLCQLCFRAVGPKAAWPLRRKQQTPAHALSPPSPSIPPHRDVCDLPFGWCAIQPLGNFDAQKRGHLVLWDVKLVVEFPAGALILLPSATIAHSNVPVQDGEERISFTQFTAGGLFRYVDNGFRTQEQLAQEDPGNMPG
ncbi:hypothetical protein MSAN_02472900 [Mycena sanguinolenta]|uniref:Uncharacterized protein n=1 Tax=Mycena sanguinolenta TaxID=230812 RepID=A0A8H6U2B3_9AGAR|nr:hypothetical protein MSAN_02472900 [Mycena sanguinolenta]